MRLREYTSPPRALVCTVVLRRREREEKNLNVPGNAKITQLWKNHEGGNGSGLLRRLSVVQSYPVL